MYFPQTRMRRLRENPVVRELVRDVRLGLDDLIMPLFVDETISAREPIGPMPGQYRYPLSEIAGVASELVALGVRGVILFGIPAAKDEQGSGAYIPDGVVQQALGRIRGACPELLLITDVCLCEYTSHGHCGVIRDGRMLNDPTLELLARTAVSHVHAGADMVAPSDMTDGRVGAIRRALDAEGYEHVPLMSYAVKYASAYYGPFRDAAGSTPQFGDRRSYQMDYARTRDAVHEVELDVAEGADIVMVKPALAYLDVITRVRDSCRVPVAAYNVSGEYAILKAGAAAGYIDEQQVVLETLSAMRRAGADIILSYHTADVARWLAD